MLCSEKGLHSWKNILTGKPQSEFSNLRLRIHNMRKQNMADVTEVFAAPTYFVRFYIQTFSQPEWNFRQDLWNKVHTCCLGWLCGVHLCIVSVELRYCLCNWCCGRVATKSLPLQTSGFNFLCWSHLHSVWTISETVCRFNVHVFVKLKYWDKKLNSVLNL